ncbi:MAG: phosphatase PAP2 family protein [Saprospiraceae bacterium]|nr:phosphatase PAP2 family protein [Saprospiraceae bacterium]
MQTSSIFCLPISFPDRYRCCCQVKLEKYQALKFTLDQNHKPQHRSVLREEMKEIISLQSKMDADDPLDINFWNGAYPAYRWHEIMMDISDQHQGHKNGGRVAILHLAIYDATTAVWEHKTKNAQLAPFHWNREIRKFGREPDHSTFICEWSVAAGAAKEIISYYFPEKEIYLDSLVEEFKRTRVLTGLQFLSDIEIGVEIGKTIAKEYIDYAKTDRTDIQSQGTELNKPRYWTGNPGKWDPMKAQWRPLTLQRADQFRPGLPPDFSRDMAELRQFNATHTTSDIAWKWKSEPVWDNLIERKILEYDLDPLEAAFANAMHHAARFDATIAAWDGKYHYMGIRPFQFDPTFKPILVETPNFPGYPAGHTTVAGSIATVLSYLFPQDKEFFSHLALECSESRFEGGVHFRTDNEVGLEVGRKVGEKVIEAFSGK